MNLMQHAPLLLASKKETLRRKMTEYSTAEQIDTSTKTAWVSVSFGRQRSSQTCWSEILCNTLVLHIPCSLQESESDKPKSVTIVPLQWNKTEFLQREQKICIKRSSLPEVFLSLPSVSDTKAWFVSLLNASTTRTAQQSDFEPMKRLGKGTFGSVFLVKRHLTGEKFALKAIWKHGMPARQALEERLILEKVAGHPFILNIKFAFQTRTHLCIVTEYCSGGDLQNFLRPRSTPLPEETVRRIAAEILLALEHVHSRGIIYRDLKPANILLDEEGHIRLADFGFSKILCKTATDAEEDLENEMFPEISPPQFSRSDTLCGSPLYMSPEIWDYKQTPYDQSVDIWAFGIVLYELLCCRVPFFGNSAEEVRTQVKYGRLTFPSCMSSSAVNLISALLEKNFKMRLGTRPNGISDIKNSPFFAGLDWAKLLERRSHADNLRERYPIVEVAGTDSLSSFEAEDGSNFIRKLMGLFSSRKKYEEIAGYEFSSEQDN